MRAALPVCLFLISQTFVFGQVSSFEVIYNGISPNEPSPHTANVDGNIGIKNPERGYSIRGGVFDIYSDTDFPNESYYSDLNGDADLNLDPLAAYYNWFIEDGISLVELEAYINYTDDMSNPNASLNSSHISEASVQVPELLNNLGVKSHFILNSSFKFYQNGTDGISNVLVKDDNRYTKTLNYFDEAAPVFKALNPYVAVAHLGWISSPWDFNQYRHSANWKKSNFDIGTNYAIGKTIYNSDFKNFHGTHRESIQRSSWGAPHNLASVWHFQSAINHLKTDVLNKTLDVFSDKKVLLKSTHAVAQYIGTSLNMSTPVYAPTYPINFVDRVMSGQSYTGTPLLEELIGLQDEDRFLRIGYYENAFGGDTYSHYWTIGNAYTQHLQWGSDFPGYLGADWANNPYYTDVNNLRLYRGHMWMHGEMPVYETEDPIVNTTQNLNAWFTSSFNRNHQYYSNWYEGTDGVPNTQYDYEIGEGISSGRLQDGFYSALKLKYFNFTSFNISHNNLLDGRSPYEMPDGFDNSAFGEVLVGNGIPNAENTAIAGWKTKMISESELTQFGMPVSKNYFKDANGGSVDRSAYDYIRDHLGYRLELQSTQFVASSANVNFTTTVINRGFAAPQNKRSLYFVLMNEANQLIKYVKTDVDWRTWQPDEFSDGTTNPINLQFPLTNATYSSMDELIIGGIPLGEHNSEWHHSPITSYNPYTYTLEGNFTLSELPEGQYKVGILLPDNDENLSVDGRYAVRFANQAQFIPCTGVTVLGHVTIGSSSNDNDGDGIANESDSKPNRPDPTDYFQLQLSSTEPCEEFLTKIQLPDFEEKPFQERLALSPNPVKNTLQILSKDPWTEGQVITMNGQVVINFDNTTNLVDVSGLDSGVFIIKLKGQKDAYIQRFVKEE